MRSSRLLTGGGGRAGKSCHAPPQSQPTTGTPQALVAGQFDSETVTPKAVAVAAAREISASLSDGRSMSLWVLLLLGRGDRVGGEQLGADHVGHVG
jgi:hypothetical protein